MITNILFNIFNYYKIFNNDKKIYYAILIAILFYTALYFGLNIFLKSDKKKYSILPIIFIDFISIILLNKNNKKKIKDYDNVTELENKEVNTFTYSVSDKNGKNNDIYDNKSKFHSLDNRTKKINDISIDIKNKELKQHIDIVNSNENIEEIINKKDKHLEFPNKNNTFENDNKFVSEEDGNLIEE